MHRHIFTIAPPLLKWAKQSGRNDLPWQKNISPYRVWLSEIMLQQTQVNTVIPYFEKFIFRYPSIETLANSSLEEIFQLWSGLGYYARARNLHKTAHLIWHEYAGNFPNTLEELVKLPGIGRSTAGAILSIAFKISTPILDGNVKRVLARFYSVYGAINHAKTIDTLWDLATQNTPEKNGDQYTQAIMDLGATICIRKKPKCDVCPISNNCRAFLNGTVHEFPQKIEKSRLPSKEKIFLVLTDQNNQILLERRPLQGIWGGLWSLPECNTDDEIKLFCQTNNLIILKSSQGTPFKHTFSHFYLNILPTYVEIKRQYQVRENANFRWCSLDKAIEIGLATPIKKLLSKPYSSVSS